MILVFLVNLIVGGLVGLSGIAGFLLPIFYVSVSHLGTTEALALSFAAFIVSGTLGSLSYFKQHLLKLKPAIILSIGSFCASWLGAQANLLIPEHLMNQILYLVVLFSGLSILLRRNRQRASTPKTQPWLLISIGFVTGFICAITGAGGPVVVLPILIMLGIDVHQAVAIALFNSIFIGIPAATGYFLHSNLSQIAPFLPVALIAHAIGVWFGGQNGHRINQTVLKQAVALFSILIALVKLIGG